MKNGGQLTLIPTSGLANRLRIIAVAIKLARESNKKLCVYWQSDQYLNADYEDLFELPENIRITKPPLKFAVWFRIKSLSPRLQQLSDQYLRLFHFDFLFLDSMSKLVWHNKINLQDEVDKSTNVLMVSCQEFNYFKSEDYQLFVPKAALQKKIDACSAKFNDNTIGIHIRSTDNKDSIKNSPFQLFAAKIEEEIILNPGATFFLSTDNKSYQDILMKKYGSNIILFNDKEFSRNKTQGIKDAVVDLFCLSKTSKIYGSYFSSFSAVAARIGGIRNEVLRKEVSDN